MGQPSAAKDRLSELADYRKSTVTAMFLRATKKTKACYLGRTQRKQYRLHLKEIAYHPARIQALESMVLNGSASTAWEDRLSELADYRNGHCNVLPNTPNPSLYWSLTKGTIQAAPGRKEIANDLLPVFSHWLAFEWTTMASPGKNV
jgi:hypothetical protein